MEYDETKLQFNQLQNLNLDGLATANFNTSTPGIITLSWLDPNVSGITLPNGTVIQLKATFDNSKDNPNNPNKPPKAVGWGEKTTDEMCIAFLGVLRQSEYDALGKAKASTKKKTD